MSVAGFTASQRTEHDVPHAVACRALGVSESWFYKWRNRPPTPRRDRGTRLAAAIQKVFDHSGGTYGSPRIGSIELREQGWQVSDNTIAQLMAELGLTARAKRRRRVRDFVWGLLAPLPRKNCWTIAEHAGDASPDGMQDLLGRAKWDDGQVRANVGGFVAEHRGQQNAHRFLLITGDPLPVRPIESRRRSSTVKPPQA